MSNLAMTKSWCHLPAWQHKDMVSTDSLFLSARGHLKMQSFTWNCKTKSLERPIDIANSSLFTAPGRALATARSFGPLSLASFFNTTRMKLTAWPFLLPMVLSRSPWLYLVLLMTLVLVSHPGILPNHSPTCFRECKTMPSYGMTYYGPEAVALNSLSVATILYTTDFTPAASLTSITNTHTGSPSNHLPERKSYSEEEYLYSLYKSSTFQIRGWHLQGSIQSRPWQGKRGSQ